MATKCLQHGTIWLPGRPELMLASGTEATSSPCQRCSTNGALDCETPTSERSSVSYVQPGHGSGQPKENACRFFPGKCPEAERAAHESLSSGRNECSRNSRAITNKIAFPAALAPHVGRTSTQPFAPQQNHVAPRRFSFSSSRCVGAAVVNNKQSLPIT